jgi:hypothetical protein
MPSPTPDGARFCSVAETLAVGRIAMADPAVPVREAIVRLLSHLSTMQPLLDDAAERSAVAFCLTPHRASSRRLRRMLLLLARTSAGDRRGRRLDADTLRTTLVRQLNEHLEIERELLARLDDVLSPADDRAFAERHDLLMVEAVADPRWARIFGPDRPRWWTVLGDNSGD